DMLTIVLPGARDCESEWAGSRPPLWLPTPSTKRARRHTRQDGAALTRAPWLNTCHGESPVAQPRHALRNVHRLRVALQPSGDLALGSEDRPVGGEREIGQMGGPHGIVQAQRLVSRAPLGSGPLPPVDDEGGNTQL